MLKGWTFKDRLPNGPGKEDSGKDYWDIHISGTGFEGESIDVIVSAGTGGYWDYGMSYTFNHNDSAQIAELTICEVPIANWYQTYLVDDGCYTITIDPAVLTLVGDLDFGNWADGIPRQ